MADRNLSRWSILAAVLVGTVMGPIDASVVYIALPAMTKYFGVAPATMSWVSMAYLLVMARFLLSFGRLGDLLGFRKLFLSGLLLFVVTSALCGMAPSLGVLIFLRALQAAGAGMAMSMSTAIITAVFPSEERGRALGPSLGGLLVSTVGWRAIFFVNVPLGIIALIWCYRVLPDIQGQGRRSFDWLGALLAFAGLGTLLLFVDWVSTGGWSWSTILFGLTALVSLGWFFLLEKSIAEPMLDLGLFRSRVFSAANAAALLNFMTQYVIVFVTPFLFQQAIGLSAARAGQIMTAFPLAVLVMAPLSGTLSDKIGQRWLAFTGSLACTVGAALLAWFSGSGAVLGVALCLSVFGLGTGIFQSPNTSAVMWSVPKPRLGIASRVLATTRNVGMVLGIVIAGAMLSAAEVAQGATHGTLLSGLSNAYLAAAVLSALGTLVCLLARDSGARVGPLQSRVDS